MGLPYSAMNRRLVAWRGGRGDRGRRGERRGGKEGERGRRGREERGGERVGEGIGLEVHVLYRLHPIWLSIVKHCICGSIS